MAEWCVITGQAPSVWRELSRTERDAFYRALKETARAADR